MKESTSTWQQRAEAVIAQGCLTYSKSRRYYVEDQPSHVRVAYEQYLITPEETVVLDTVSGLGSNLIDIQNNFSLPSIHEVEYCERVVERIGKKGWKVKLVKTGSEADQAATRFARGFTNRKNILKLGYTGWHNEFIAAEHPGTGCIGTDVYKCTDYEDLIKRLRDHYPAPIPAAVIMEPVMLDMDVKHHLQEIRKLCTDMGVVLIFDEVITCMRMPNYTVAATFGVWPDIITTGKAMGGGYPLGIVMGRPDIMDTDGVFVSGTFSGETSALKAGLAVLDRMTPTEMSSFFKRMVDFQTALQWAVKDHIHIEGYGTRMVLRDKWPGAVPRFMQEMYKRHHILIGPVLFPRVGWESDIIGKIVTAAGQVCAGLKDVQLNGPAPRPVFKR